MSVLLLLVCWSGRSWRSGCRRA